jgi:hypothetical protein
VGSLRNYHNNKVTTLPLENLWLTNEVRNEQLNLSLQWSLWQSRIKFSIWWDNYRHPDQICMHIYQFSPVYFAHIDKKRKRHEALELLTSWYERLKITRKPWWVCMNFPEVWIQDMETYHNMAFTADHILQISQGRLVHVQQFIFPWLGEERG